MSAFLLNLVRPYLVQLAIAGAIAAAAGIGFVTLKAHYTNEGYQRAIDGIAADNREAVDAADKARDRVRKCSLSGGVWDASRCVCDRRT